MQTSRTLSADWNGVLGRVETALARAVAQLECRQHAPAATVQAGSALDFGRFEEHFGAFAACPVRVEQRLAQIDSVLGEGEDAVRQWLGRAEVVRRKLAAWVVSATPAPPSGQPGSQNPSLPPRETARSS